MKFSENYLQVDSKYRIYIREWIPKEKVKKNLFIIHGLGEHSGRYEDLAKILTQEGIGVFSIDLIGHGKSSGKKGHIKINDQVILDEKFEIKKVFRNTNYFIWT